MRINHGGPSFKLPEGQKLNILKISLGFQVWGGKLDKFEATPTTPLYCLLLVPISGAYTSGVLLAMCIDMQATQCNLVCWFEIIEHYRKH